MMIFLLVIGVEGREGCHVSLLFVAMMLHMHHHIISSSGIVHAITITPTNHAPGGSSYKRSTRRYWHFSCCDWSTGWL